MRVAIEMDDTRPNSKGYGKVHAEGCRDLRDGMRLHMPDGSDPQGAHQLSESLLCSLGDDWDYDHVDVVSLIAPCANGVRN